MDAFVAILHNLVEFIKRTPVQCFVTLFLVALAWVLYDTWQKARRIK